MEMTVIGRARLAPAHWVSMGKLLTRGSNALFALPACVELALCVPVRQTLMSTQIKYVWDDEMTAVLQS